MAILYVLPFIFSKKLRPGWLLFTLVIFILDTLFMLIDVGVQSDMLVDYLFHIWVIVSLFIGVSAGYKLKKLPSEEEEQPEWEQPAARTHSRTELKIKIDKSKNDLSIFYCLFE